MTSPAPKSPAESNHDPLADPHQSDYPSRPTGNTPVTPDSLHKHGTNTKSPTRAKTTRTESTMAQLTTQPNPLPTTPTLRLPLGRMAIFIVASPLLLGAITAAAAWSTYGVGSLDALVGSAVFAIAALASAAALMAIKPSNLATAGSIILFVSVSRLGLALILAVALYLVRQPTPVPYWIGFLLAGLASLVAETILATNAIRKSGLSSQEHDA